MHALVKAQLDRISRLYYRSRNIWPIWHFLLNRQGRRVWASAGEALVPVGRGIAKTLAKEGIAITNLDLLFPGESPLPAMQAYARRRFEERTREAAPAPSAPVVPDGKPRFKYYVKDFLLDLWEGGVRYPAFEFSNPFIRFALDESILAIAAAYLGSAPKFNDFTLQATLPVEPGTPQAYSQRWHRDPEDKRMAKAFIYLSDVPDASAGAFTYIRGSHYGGRWQRLYPQRPPVGRYPEPGAVERIVPASDIRVCTGPVGTVIFCDTSGLHRGGYTTGRERLMLTAAYVTGASVHPPRYPRPNNLAFASSLPLLARYAIEP